MPLRRSLSFDRVADRYDATRGGEERGRRLAGELDRALDPSAAVLEVGVGTGLVAEGLRGLGHRVVGVDVSPAMAARARARLGPRVAVGDAARLPVAGGSLRQAYSVWVLHVVGDQLEVLEEVARVLRPGGRYLVVPGHVERPRDELGEELWELERALDPQRRRIDDPERLGDLGARVGLRLVDVVPCEPYPFGESPAAMAGKIEDGVYSCLWDISRERWRSVVEPALARLRALPEPERPRRREHRWRVLVIERER